MLPGILLMSATNLNVKPVEVVKELPKILYLDCTLRSSNTLLSNYSRGFAETPKRLMERHHD